MTVHSMTEWEKNEQRMGKSHWYVQAFMTVLLWEVQQSFMKPAHQAASDGSEAKEAQGLI